MNFLKPINTFFLTTCNNNIKHSPIKIMHSTKIKNTIFPNRFQWIFKYMYFAAGFGIGSVKNSAVPDIPLGPVFRGYEGIGFRKLLVQ